MGGTCGGQGAPIVWHEHERFMSPWDPTEPVFDEDDMFLPPVVVSVLTAVLGDLGLRPSMVTAAATTGLAATSPRLGKDLGKGLWEQQGQRQPYDVDFKESSSKKTQQSEAQRIDWKTYYTSLEVVSVDAYQSQPGSGYEADDELSDSDSDCETESESEDWESDSGSDCETQSGSEERELDSDWTSSSKWEWNWELDSDCEPKSKSDSWPESQSDSRETFGLDSGIHFAADSKSS